MSKKNLVVVFLLLSGVIVVLAYAAGNQSNWLTDNQINFSDKLSTNHGNKLTARIRDSLMNGLTTWAQNHERRLQAFAQSSGYPNLDDHQTSFADLLSTKHNNMLTAEMWNGLVNKLTMVVSNHEMRLRAINIPNPPTPTGGKCVGTYQGGKNSYEGKLVPSSEIKCFSRTNIGNKFEEWKEMENNNECDKRWKKYSHEILTSIYTYDNLSTIATGYKHTVISRGYRQEHDFYSIFNCPSHDVGLDGTLGFYITQCKYNCTDSHHDPKFCDAIPIRESCENLNELACKQHTGCSRDE